MMKVTLPNGLELNVPWSNMAPCSTIAESLAKELGLTMYPLKKSREDIAKDVAGGSFGGKREQWYFVKDLVIRLPVTSMSDKKPHPTYILHDFTIGPLLVIDNLCDLVLGFDLIRAVGGTFSMAKGWFTFPELNLTTPTQELKFYNRETGNEVIGSCSWMWNDGVETNTCAKCNFTFPHLSCCSKCEVTYYCSKECQRSDWKQHKNVCKKEE